MSNQFGHVEIDLFNMPSEINNCHNLIFFSPNFFNKKTKICSRKINKCHNLDFFLLIFLVKKIMICNSGCMFK